MIDWTDTHCRHFHRICAPGASLYTEMVHANAIIHGQRERFLAKDASQHPVALQLGGSDPAALAQATALASQAGFDEINLNCGCPSDRVQSGNFGACLMRTPVTVRDCIRAMRDATDKPVTVKCRLGVDDDDRYALFRNFVATVAQTGCDHFIIHARNAWLQGLSPKENREIPPLKYEWAYRLKKEHPHWHVVLNGGIRSPDEALQHLEHVDSVMLGRIAYHEPMVLHQVDAALHGHPVMSRHGIMQAYRPYVEAQLEKGARLSALMKPTLGLFTACHGGRAFRQILSENAHRPGADWNVVAQALAVTDTDD